MKQYYQLFIVFCILFSISSTVLPVAIFHGIGDSCYFPGMSNIASIFSENLGGVYAACIESGGGPFDWFTSIKHQSENACQKIKDDPNFQGDFSVVGLSQGALIARYIIEKCEMKGRVKRYISVGGPQMGVGSLPQCTGTFICDTVNKVIGMGVYTSLAQTLIGPAGYYKDAANYETYLNYSSFLADLNNEKQEKMSSHKERFTALEKVVLIKFSEDTMIIPRETAWFQFYNSELNLMDLQDSEFYIKDFIGVKTLNEQNKIEFVELKGNHLKFSHKDITTYMIPALN